MGDVVFCEKEKAQVLVVERKLREGVGNEGGRLYLNEGGE